MPRHELSVEEQQLVSRPLAALSEAELERRGFAQTRVAHTARSAWARWRARRDARRAFDVRTARVVARMGRGRPSCDRCGGPPPTVHVAYGQGAAARFGHFCDTCSRSEPPGWLVVAEGPARKGAH